MIRRELSAGVRKRRGRQRCKRVVARVRSAGIGHRDLHAHRSAGRRQPARHLHNDLRGRRRSDDGRKHRPEAHLKAPDTEVGAVERDGLVDGAGLRKELRRGRTDEGRHQQQSLHQAHSLFDVRNRQAGLPQIGDHRRVNRVSAARSLQRRQRVERVPRRSWRNRNAFSDTHHPRGLQTDGGLHTDIQAVHQVGIGGAVDFGEKHIQVDGVGPWVGLRGGGRGERRDTSLALVRRVGRNRHFDSAHEACAGDSGSCGRDPEILAVLTRRQRLDRVSIRSRSTAVSDVTRDHRAQRRDDQIVKQIQIAIQQRHTLLDVDADVPFQLVGYEEIQW